MVAPPTESRTLKQIRPNFRIALVPEAKRLVGPDGAVATSGAGPPVGQGLDRGHGPRRHGSDLHDPIPDLRTRRAPAVGEHDVQASYAGSIPHRPRSSSSSSDLGQSSLRSLDSDRSARIVP